MLLCFLAYMLYTTAWRFTTSSASLASLMKPDASTSSLCARKSCFVLLSTYLQNTSRQGRIGFRHPKASCESEACDIERLLTL